MGTEINNDDVARLRMTLGRISRLLDRQSLGSGLTRTQLSVLGTVARKGPMRIGDLAEAEGLNPTMLSRVLAILSDSGLVRRLADRDDARVSLIEITAAGSREHQRIREQRSRLLRAGLDALEADHAEHLIAALPLLEELFEHMRDGAASSAPRRAKARA